MENLQAGLLAFACLVFAFLAVQKTGLRLVFAFSALLCCGLFLREVDVQKLDVPRLIQIIGGRPAREVILALGLLAIGIRAVQNWSTAKKSARTFLCSKAGALFLACGVFLVVGDTFEKLPQIPHHVFLEEAAEMLGDALMLIAALTSLLRFSQTGQDQREQAL